MVVWVNVLFWFFFVSTMENATYRIFEVFATNSVAGRVVISHLSTGLQVKDQETKL